MKEGLSVNFERNERFGFAAAAAIISVMMFCAGLTIEQFLQRLAPSWSLGFLPWLALFTALEAIYSQSFVYRWSDFSWERISYRLSEALVIIFLVKSIFYFRMGGEAFLAEISRYSFEFFDTFFNPEVNAALMFTFLVWMLSARMAGHLLDMGDDRLVLDPAARPGFFLDRGLVRRRLASIVFFFGAVLVFLAALTRTDLDVVWRESAIIEATAFNVIVYFVLGLVLLSLAQFAVMRGRWGWERTPIRMEIGRAWLRYSVVFFLVILAVVILLPTGYSLSLFQTLGVFFRFLGAVVTFIFYLMMLPIMLLLARMLNAETVENFERPENPFAGMGELPQAAESGPAAATVPFLEWLQSVLFWAAFLFVIVYAFVQFAKHNEGVWNRIQSTPFLRGLIKAWEGLVAWLWGVGKSAEAAVQSGVRQFQAFREGRRAVPVWDFLGVNRLSPRERIFFFYRAMLRRAGENKVVRRQSQTPLEYRRKLEKVYPEVSAEISEMTAGFEAARYGPHETTEDQANFLKLLWAKLRKAMGRPDHQGSR